MTIDDYIDELEATQNHLLRMHEDDVFKETFTQEQQKLEALVKRLSQFSKEEQQRVQPIMESFSQKLGKKLEKLKTRLHTLSQDMHQQEIRLKGIKAYGQNGRIF